LERNPRQSHAFGSWVDRRIRGAEAGKARVIASVHKDNRTHDGG
jgi:hypothetical protein